MTKSSAGAGQAYGGRPAPALERSPSPVLRREGACDLYAPGHQIHYRHQGDAVRSPSVPVRDTLLHDTEVTLLLDGERELHWRHHDPERLRRMLELLRGRCVAYPAHHALRVGPYWFNCAAEHDDWQECRRTRTPVTE
ncbi:MAG: hypothetical protein WB441_16440 [Nocardioidaceae bacterium]